LRIGVRLSSSNNINELWRNKIESHNKINERGKKREIQGVIERERKKERKREAGEK